MITDELSDLEFIPNTKYKIKSKNNEFKYFNGIISGISGDIYEWKGIRCTGDHLILINDKWEVVKDLHDTIKIDTEEKVYDILGVEEYSAYESGGYIHHNCQTGEQLIEIRDKKSNKIRLVTFEQLKQIIELDNNGIDYFESKIINI
jgi:hypothetical protein